ncbi:MAG TPA: DUF2156 domain-containing protein [Candidatus Kapabacteria bacterium]|nr:DUF2156 domain-containing protein [Candidatus Kapabacteria bacterium]
MDGSAQSHPNGSSSRVEHARRLVLAHGWNATAYQIINPGIDHWFTAAGNAVVGFVHRRGVRVVAGAPVCARERLATVVEEFESDAVAGGERVCYFGAEARLEGHFRGDRSHSMVLLGAQPVWHPDGWPQIVAGRASLRAQLNRARNKGVRIVEWSSEQATGHPQLRRCLAEWLATRGLPPLHFLVEPQTLERLSDRRIFVAQIGGDVVGFLVASPIPVRHGWLVEQIVRGTHAPNGSAELLIDSAFRAMSASGADYVTLGLSPLSRRMQKNMAESPLWIRALLGWVRAHGRRFYNFDGLDAFKAKFQPDDWEPVYAIANEPRFRIRTLYAVAEAFAGGSPIAMIARSVFRRRR